MFYWPKLGIPDHQTFRLRSDEFKVLALYARHKSSQIDVAALNFDNVQANDLMKKLEEDGEEFEKEFYFTAGYDAPFK